MSQFKPMLASKTEIEKLNYPQTAVLRITSDSVETDVLNKE